MTTAFIKHIRDWNTSLFNILLLSHLLILNSCGKPDDCVKSTGKIIVEERALDKFSTIHISDNVQLHLTDNSGSTIKVKAGKNIISNIKTEVIGGTLYITNENKCNWLRSYKKDIIVYAGIKDIKGIFHYGASDIHSDQLTKDTLFFHHYGNGDVYLNCTSKLIWMDMDHLGDFNIDGTVETFIARNIHIGELKASGLLADTIWLTNQGQGNSYVRAKNVLGAAILNSGDVYYYGSPLNASAEEKGTGKLIKGD